MSKKGDLLTLFITFLKIGAFTFGGGYAMIPFIQREAVENHKWINEEDVLDIVAIAETTPGVIAVNSATFIGYKVAGFWGAVLATIGVVLPSFVIICIIAAFLIPFMSNKWVALAFRGIRIGVIVLMVGAILKLIKQNKLNAFFFIILVLSFVTASFTSINVLFVLLGALVVGIVYSLLMRRGKKA
ncbi:MAG: chromate transporter [Christensenellaceae bacterium]